MVKGFGVYKGHVISFHKQLQNGPQIRNLGQGSLRDPPKMEGPCILATRKFGPEKDHRSVTGQDELFSKIVSSRCGMREYGITILKNVV
jgi:hypothetical protein